MFRRNINNNDNRNNENINDNINQPRIDNRTPNRTSISSYAFAAISVAIFSVASLRLYTDLQASNDERADTMNNTNRSFIQTYQLMTSGMRFMGTLMFIPGTYLLGSSISSIYTNLFNQEGRANPRRIAFMQGLQNPNVGGNQQDRFPLGLDRAEWEQISQSLQDEANDESRRSAPAA